MIEFAVVTGRITRVSNAMNHRHCHVPIAASLIINANKQNARERRQPHVNPGSRQILVKVQHPDRTR